MTLDIEVLRVVDDPALTADAVVYEIAEPDDLNPDRPVRFRIDLTNPEYALLTQSQPGPWIVADTEVDMSLDLSTLVRLGEVAGALLDQQNQDGHYHQGEAMTTTSGISRITMQDGSTVDVPAVLSDGRIEIVAPQQFLADDKHA